MSQVKIPWGKYLLWFIAMFVGVGVLGYLYGPVVTWMNVGSGMQGSPLFSILSFVLMISFPLWLFFCMYKMYKAYQQANAPNVPPPPQRLQQSPPASGTNLKFCLNCGASIPSVSTYCPKCGAQQIQT